MTGRTSTLINVVAMLVFSLFRRLIGLISIASLARLLTPSDMGAYAFTQSTGQTFVGLFRFGAIQGLQVSLARRLSEEGEGDAGALIGGGILLICGIAAAGAAIMLAFADPIARDIFGAPELAPYILVSTAFFVGQFLSRGAYVGFAGLGRFVDYSYLAGIIGMVTVAATILGAVVFGVQGAVWGFAGATLAGVPVFLLGLLKVLRGAGIRIRWTLRRAHVREVFSIGLPFYGAGALMIPAAFLAQGAVSRYGGVSDLADLRIIMALVGVVELVPQAIAGPIISLFSEREGRRAGTGMASAITHFRFLWIFSLVTGAIMVAVWPLAVWLIFGPGYPQVVQVGLLGVIAFLPTIVGTALMAGILVGRNTLPLLLTGAVEAAVMIGLALLLVPVIGLAGFFAAKGVAGVVSILLRLAVLGRQTGTSPLRRWMGPLLVATLVLCALSLLDTQVAASALERSVVAALGLPALCLWIAFAALSAQERTAILGRARREIGQLRTRMGRAGKGENP